MKFSHSTRNFLQAIGDRLLRRVRYQDQGTCVNARIFDRFSNDPMFRDAIIKRVGWKLPHKASKNDADKLFSKRTFLSLQDTEVSSLEGLKYFPNLTVLHCLTNRIVSIEPVRQLHALRCLTISRNNISNIEPLNGCLDLEDIELGNNPIEDFTVLKELSKLRELTITADQLPKLKAVGSLNSLLKLHIDGDFTSLQELPDLPQLLILNIQCCNVKDMSGIERFKQLRNLWAVGNHFSDISPIALCSKLTHVNLNGTLVDVTPLSKLLELRSLYLQECGITDIRSLHPPPALHEISLKKNPISSDEIAKFQESLSSWDIEFGVDHLITISNIELKVISQEQFDHYDSHPFNVADFDGNAGMFDSEREWLVENIMSFLKIDFQEDDFFYQPKGVIRRSETIVMVTENSVRNLPLAIQHIQRALLRAKQEWIVYLQADLCEVDYDFVVWVHRDHIEVTEKDKPIVERLLFL